MNMYGFIGVGQGGTSVVSLASKLGYPSVAINFSQKDLDGCKEIQNENKLCLIGSEGVGRDRNEALRLMNFNWERVVSFIEERFSHPSIKIIFIAFSTGGGTGSGSSPMIIELLKHKLGKVIVACPILPDLTEVTINQLNTLDVFSELSNLQTCILPIDNQKANSNLNKHTKYMEINCKFINQIHQLLKYTREESSISNLDERDLLTIFDTDGLAIIGDINVTEESKFEDEQWIYEKTKQSWLCSIYIEPEMKKVIKAGVIFDYDSKTISNTHSNRLFRHFDFGEPINLFEGYYSTGASKIITICSGLSWCETRLKQIEQKIHSDESRIKSTLQPEKRYRPDLDISLFNKKEQKTQEKRSITEILTRYQR
ncbi:cell division protein FtsZ [Halalkalibacter oceani]|uniref:cell division protein FtsZ n=1 Tax=Halalkalibacter oceani TaxID=1653776 RepID=UPI003398DD0F